MNRRTVIVAMWALMVMGPGLAAAQGDLERARSLYNAGQFDDSIAAATSARSRTSAAASATLIIARSRLEKFRRRGDLNDLTTARAELASLNPRNLAPQEAIEWQIGVGAALFLENELAAAAEMFTAVLPTARERLRAGEYEKLLEWWGSTLSRLAESLTGELRRRAYERLLIDTRVELERNPLSRPTMYWHIVALRGGGDLEAAWAAALASWIRAAGQAEGTQLRDDLDRFVTQTLIPERAQVRTAQRLDSTATAAEIASLTEEWRTITARWKGSE